MKRSIILRIAIILFCIFFMQNNAEAKKYKVLSGGKSLYTIIVSDNASESEKYAARELQIYLAKIGSINIPIKKCGEGTIGKRILVGYNDDVKKLLSSLKQPHPDDEAFTYQNVGGDIVIVGGSDRGTIYGVYTFLEREFGCRWYTQTLTVIPKRTTYKFRKLNFSDAPKILIRNMMYSETLDPAFRVHLRINEKIKTSPVKPEAQPGGCYALWAPHTLVMLLPVGDYYKKHPEYYALQNGKRKDGNTQLCFTNKEALKQCISNLRKVMRERPEFDRIEVSASDNLLQCECQDCKSAIRQMGNYTDLVLDFVNKVAEAVENEFPTKKVEFLAYQSLRMPPVTVKPRHNVVVRIADIEVCHSHGFAQCTSSEAKKYYKELESWRSLTNELNVWEYASNFSAFFSPYPNFYSLQENLKTYQRIGVKGIMEEGNHYTQKGDFQDLHVYVLSRLLWDPYCDVNAVVDDFMKEYYGKAAPYIRKFFDLVHRKVKVDTHLLPGVRYDDEFYDEQFIRSALSLFRKAKKRADNKEVLRRVELEELSVLLVNIFNNPHGTEKDDLYLSVQEIIKRECIDLHHSYAIERIDVLK